jgi:hypothetical protein
MTFQNPIFLANVLPSLDEAFLVGDRDQEFADLLWSAHRINAWLDGNLFSDADASVKNLFHRWHKLAGEYCTWALLRCDIEKAREPIRVAYVRLDGLL